MNLHPVEREVAFPLPGIMEANGILVQNARVDQNLVVGCIYPEALLLVGLNDGFQVVFNRKQAEILGEVHVNTAVFFRGINREVHVVLQRISRDREE